VTTQIVAVAILAPAATAHVSVSGKATSVVPSWDRNPPVFP